MSDVYLFQTPNDGDIEFKDGDITIDSGIRTAAYLSLFGGNNNDGGFDDTTFTWWANYSETDNDLKYRSETQYLLDTEPLTSNLLRRIEDAAERDLKWFFRDDIFQSIKVYASSQTINRLELTVLLDDLELIFVEEING